MICAISSRRGLLCTDTRLWAYPVSTAPVTATNHRQREVVYVYFYSPGGAYSYVFNLPQCTINKHILLLFCILTEVDFSSVSSRIIADTIWPAVDVIMLKKWPAACTKWGARKWIIYIRLLCQVVYSVFLCSLQQTRFFSDYTSVLLRVKSGHN